MKQTRRKTVREIFEVALNFDDIKEVLLSKGFSLEGLGGTISICKSSKGTSGLYYGEILRGVDELVFKWETIRVEDVE